MIIAWILQLLALVAVGYLLAFSGWLLRQEYLKHRPRPVRPSRVTLSQVEFALSGGVPALSYTGPDITFRAVAAELNPDVVHEIEVTGPCIRSANGAHLWDWQHEQVGSIGSPSYHHVKWWQCTYCGVTAQRDARSNWARNMDSQITIHPARTR